MAIQDSSQRAGKLHARRGDGILTADTGLAWCWQALCSRLIERQVSSSAVDDEQEMGYAGADALC